MVHHVLPRLASVDPAPWLWQLARDPEVGVRTAAIAQLATSGDPAVLEDPTLLPSAPHEHVVEAPESFEYFEIGVVVVDDLVSERQGSFGVR